MKGLLRAGLLAATCASFFSTVAATPPRRDGHHRRSACHSQKNHTDKVTVDLGYEVHQGTLNRTGSFFTFSNVPYAEQPIGDLRFQKPVTITGQASAAVNKGSDEDVKCMQAYPKWMIELFAGGSTSDLAAVTAQLTGASGQTESCLVLDVRVPVNVFKARTSAQAPVLVWIHGGGFTYGSKSSDGDPAGLIARSQADKGEGIIFVSINYRLGLFGWLGGGDDVTPNLGLYDQRLALEWVKQYIGQFGGSPNRVTVMGESAGAASIVHHITAYGGVGAPAPFQSAIPQSPAFQFNINLTAGYEMTLAKASSQTGVGIRDVKTLSTLESDTLKSINQDVVYGAPTGMFNFGPGPDGTYVLKLPQVLLLEGGFDHSVNLMISHTANESVPFTPFNISTAADVRARAKFSLPEASDATLSTLLTRVYPDVLDGGSTSGAMGTATAYPWATQFARAAQITTETSFACTTRFLATAFGNATRNYIFAYPPAYHAADLPYVFFGSEEEEEDGRGAVDADLARALQGYIVAFARTGDPNRDNPGVSATSAGNGGSSSTTASRLRPEFPTYGAGGAVLRLTPGGFEFGVDDMMNGRCAWIQRAMADGLL
ncbi:Alpha/Beta hydrolase protein [Biscogniauxia marginata]|nr:Alpha/Beta hydrolase protein [Biscogniauxia marginata]